MSDTGSRQCTPRLIGEYENMQSRPWVENFSSGYFKRRMHLLPKQGDQQPWLNTQNYEIDKKEIRDAGIADDALEFSH
jgi:monooxygenase